VRSRISASIDARLPGATIGLHRLALLVVLGRVHRDEHRQLLFGRRVEQRDAAVAPLGREDRRVVSTCMMSW
jgi:hypothetical protein